MLLADEDPFGHGGSLDDHDVDAKRAFDGSDGERPPAKTLVTRAGSSTDPPVASSGSGAVRPSPVGTLGAEAPAKRRRRGAEQSASGDGGVVHSPVQPLAAQEVADSGGAASSTSGAVRISGAWGHGHRVELAGNLAWCRNCGHYATRRVGVGLARPCSGAPSPAYAGILRRLRAGLPPKAESRRKKG